MNDVIDLIAKTIGYHFWQCFTDEEAKNCGIEATFIVIRALEKEGYIIIKEKNNV